MDKAIEKALQTGDLNNLTPDQRTTYYLETCKSLGLNPNTRPFKYLELWDSNKKKKVLHLYASKDCTEQLRKLHKVTISKLERELVKELKIYTVTVYFSLPDGRQDSSIGAVSLEKYSKEEGAYIALQGDDLANAIMKAETKAKRRGTLAICGLGMLDESELESMRDFQFVPDEVVGASQTERADDSPPKPLPYDAALVTHVHDLAVGGISLDLWTGDRVDEIDRMLESGTLPNGKKVTDKTIQAMITKMQKEIAAAQPQIEQPGEDTLAVWLDAVIDAEGDADAFRTARNAENWNECQRLYVEAVGEK